VIQLPFSSSPLVRKLEPLLIAVVVIGAEVALALSIATDKFEKLLPLLVLAGVVMFVFRLPVATVVLMLVLTDFIFHERYFARNIGPVTVYPYEVLLGLLLAYAVVRPKRATWGGAAGLALAGFYAFLGIATLLGISDGRLDAAQGLNWTRPFFMLSLFWVIVRLFPDRASHERLLGVAVALAAGAGFVGLLLALKVPIGLNLQDPGLQVIHQAEGLGVVLRVRLAGLAFAYALFWYAAVRVVEAPPRERLWWGLGLAGSAACVVVSFNRNMWIGLLITLVFMLVMGAARVRARLIAAIGVLAVGIVAVTLAGGQVSERSALYPVVHRGATLFQPKELSTNETVAEREKEVKYGWRTAKDNLAIGVGAGAPFGVYFREATSRFTPPKRVARLYVHNQYLYLLLICGIPGVLCFLSFIGIAIARVVSTPVREPRLVALAAGLFAILISGAVMLSFMTLEHLVAIALLTGVLWSATDRQAPSQPPSELPADAGGLAPDRPEQPALIAS
jgi:O-antigen ligase